LRACAGLNHVLQEAAGAGHCALPLDFLKEETGKLLLVNEDIIASALERTLAAQDLLTERIDGSELVFLPQLRWAEVTVATVIRRLAREKPDYPKIDVDRAIAWYEQKTSRQLAPSQRAALKVALANRLLVLTGGPGVGKTTLVNAILMILRAKGVRCLLCAPTGRAAKRLTETTGLEARTIHRLLEPQGGTGKFARSEHRPLECDLLVVDETSMVDLS
jgi:exodeoxyribonuclease V alpha subunit